MNLFKLKEVLLNITDVVKKVNDLGLGDIYVVVIRLRVLKEIPASFIIDGIKGLLDRSDAIRYYKLNYDVPQDNKGLRIEGSALTNVTLNGKFSLIIENDRYIVIDSNGMCNEYLTNYINNVIV